MKIRVTILATWLLALGATSATLADQAYLAAPDSGGKAGAMEKKAAKEAARAEKMMKREKTDVIKGDESLDDESMDEESLDDESLDDESMDDESAGSADEDSASREDSSSDSEDESADDDSGSNADKKGSRARSEGEPGALGRDKAAKIKEANKQRQGEKRQMVEEYQDQSRAEREARNTGEAGATYVIDEVDAGEADTGEADTRQKKAKKPWWKFWDN